MKSRIGVLLISYNNFDFIEECIGSLGNLSNYNEIIIQDDCSSDLRVLEYFHRLSLNFENVKFYVNEKNEGVTINVNRGLSRMNSDYCMLSATDDFFSRELNDLLEGSSFPLLYIDQPVIYSFGTCNYPYSRLEMLPHSLILNDLSLSVALGKFNLRFQLFNKAFVDLMIRHPLQERFGVWDDRFQLFQLFAMNKRVKLIKTNVIGSFYRTNVGVSSQVNKSISNSMFRNVHIYMFKNFYDLRIGYTVLQNLFFRTVILYIIVKTYYRSLLLFFKI
jgi:glycosyltransferase involved in cell wall biosynthesis